MSTCLSVKSDPISLVQEQRWRTWTHLRQSHMQLKASVRDRLSWSKKENRLYRRQDAGMTIKSILMQCVPKRMHRIIVISRNQTLFRSWSVMNGSRKSNLSSRNFVRRSWSVTRNSLIFRSMTQRSSQVLRKWPIFLRQQQQSVRNRRKLQTGWSERPSVWWKTMEWSRMI